MTIFLTIAAIIFCVSGAIILLFPKTIGKIEAVTSKVLFAIEDKLPKLRIPLGIFFLALSIILWYTALYKG